MHPEEPFTPEPSRRVAQPGNPGGAKSECCNPHPTRPGWGQIEVPQWGHFRVLQPLRSWTAPDISDLAMDQMADGPTQPDSASNRMGYVWDHPGFAAPWLHRPARSR